MLWNFSYLAPYAALFKNEQLWNFTKADEIDKSHYKALHQTNAHAGK